MSAEYYFTIQGPGIAEFKDRGSRFIAFAFEIGDAQAFKKRLNEIKDEHPRAAHHCFAYRIGTDGYNFRSSDDGEPAGTAGRPILGQIDSKQLTNLAIVVVRYFGGTLLGVPGLINAYKTASSMALQTTPIIQKAIEIIYHLEFDYTRLNEVMVIIKKYKCSILSQQLELFCIVDIGIAKHNLELVLARFGDIASLRVEKKEH